MEHEQGSEQVKNVKHLKFVREDCAARQLGLAELPQNRERDEEERVDENGASPDERQQ